MKGDLSLCWTYGSLIMSLLLINLFFQWYAPRILVKASSHSILKMRKDVLSHAQDLPMNYYDHQPQGRIITRITHDIEGIEEFFTSSLEKMLSTTFFAVISMIAMLITHKTLGLLSILSIVPVFIFILMTKKHTRQLNRNISKSSSYCNSRLSEYSDGLEVIRIHGLEKWSKKKLRLRYRPSSIGPIKGQCFLFMESAFGHFSKYSSFFNNSSGRRIYGFERLSRGRYFNCLCGLL